MVAGYSSDGPGHPGNSQNPAVRLEGASLWLELSRYTVVFNPAEPEGVGYPAGGDPSILY